MSTRRARFVGHCDGCDETVTCTFTSESHARLVARTHHDCEIDGATVAVRERGDD